MQHYGPAEGLKHAENYLTGQMHFFSPTYANVYQILEGLVGAAFNTPFLSSLMGWPQRSHTHIDPRIRPFTVSKLILDPHAQSVQQSIVHNNLKKFALIPAPEARPVTGILAQKLWCICEGLKEFTLVPAPEARPTTGTLAQKQ